MSCSSFRVALFRYVAWSPSRTSIGGSRSILPIGPRALHRAGSREDEIASWDPFLGKDER
jgi:hypothetical protein